MIQNYIVQALILAAILIISLRVLMILRNIVNKCRADFAKVSTLELLDPRPIRMIRPEEESEPEPESEAEVATDEDHIDTI